MSDQLIRYKGFLYGHQKHKEVMAIVMDIPPPFPISGQHPRQWQLALLQIVRSTLKEVKHSSAWNCFNCGEPAHETINNPMLHLPGPGASVPRPLVMDQVYFVCRDGGACRAVVDAENREMEAALPGAKHNDLSPASRRAGETKSKHPRASACARCFKEGKVMKCAKCLTIRYCSPECQRADHNRHKVICAMVKKVENNPKLSAEEKTYLHGVIVKKIENKVLSHGMIGGLPSS